MDAIMDYVTTHQFTVAVGVFVAMLIVFFIFKKLVKLALLFLLLLIVFGGYSYFTDPTKGMTGTVKETLLKAKEETGKVVEKGRGMYDKGKAIGKKLTKDVDKVLGTGTAKEAAKE